MIQLGHIKKGKASSQWNMSDIHSMLFLKWSSGDQTFSAWQSITRTRTLQQRYMHIININHEHSSSTSHHRRRPLNITRLQ